MIVPSYLGSCLAGFLLLASTPSREPPRERFYVIVFAYQQLPIKPHLAHSFATFIKVSESAGGCEVESDTVSWLPEKLKVRVFSPRSESGRNLTLEESLAEARKHHAQVSYWGPYEIDRELYQRGIERAQMLRAGKVKYRAVDIFVRAGKVFNCVHAIGDILDEGWPLRVMPSRWGISASSQVLSRYRPYLVDPETTHDWLLPCLNLDPTTMQKRGLNERTWYLLPRLRIW